MSNDRRLYSLPTWVTGFVPDAHDLDVLADLLEVPLQRSVDQLLRLQDDGLQLGERRESDAERGVVREVLLRVVEAAEVHRSLADLAVQGDVRVDVQVRAGRREIVVGGLDRGRAVRETLAIDHRRRPADQQDVGRLEEHAAAELRRALSSDDLDLVRIVMEDAPEPLEVHLRERARDDLREAVRDAVRVADPLALDDFRALLFDRRVDEFLDVDISRHGKPPTAVRRGCGGGYMTFVAPWRDVGGTCRKASATCA